MKTFEEFLRDDKWDAEGVLDDDMPDAFDSWCAELDVQEVMDFAEEYGRKQYMAGFDRARDVVFPPDEIKNLFK